MLWRATNKNLKQSLLHLARKVKKYFVLFLAQILLKIDCDALESHKQKPETNFPSLSKRS